MINRYVTAALLAVLSFYFVREGSPQETIRVGQGSVSLQSGLMYIAKERGLFAKYGLVDAKSFVSGRYLRQLEEEGFVKRIWEK